MPKKEGFDFDFDERTDVPTYEEISSTLKTDKKRKNLGAKKQKKVVDKSNETPETEPPKKGRHLVHILVIAFIIVLICASGFVSYKYYDKIGPMFENSNDKISGLVTGYFVNDVNYEDEMIWGIEIKGVKIDLLAEENKLTEDLTTEHDLECEEEKGKVAKDIREQKTNECAREKEELEDEIDELTERVDSLESKLSSCNDDLDDCESG